YTFDYATLDAAFDATFHAVGDNSLIVSLVIGIVIALRIGVRVDVDLRMRCNALWATRRIVVFRIVGRLWRGGRRWCLRRLRLMVGEEGERRNDDQRSQYGKKARAGGELRGPVGRLATRSNQATDAREKRATVCRQ